MLKKMLLFSAALLITTAAYSYETEEKIYINGSSGKLSAVIRKPVIQNETEYPVVILSHGFMSNKEAPLLTEMAERLVSTGFIVISYDFNGHGESDGMFQNMTVLSEVDDLKAVISYVRSLPFAGSVSLAGHSQGGVVTFLVAGELQNEIESIVLMAPAAVLVDDARNGRIMGKTYDPEDVPEYVEVFGHNLGREYILEAQNLDIYQSASRYMGDICIIHGSSDSIVPVSYSERYHEVYESSELHIVGGETHGFDRHQERSVDIAVEFLNKLME